MARLLAGKCDQAELLISSRAMKGKSKQFIAAINAEMGRLKCLKNNPPGERSACDLRFIGWE
jgi:hypothetical protein